MVAGMSGAGEMVVRRCTFHTNGENGVEIRDYSNAVTIESCLIFENFHNGLYVTRAIREGTRTIEGGGLLSLRRSQISRNRRYGLSLSKVPCELLETVIAENNSGAIEVDEDSKSLIQFADTTPTRLRELVKGEIGGEWGHLYPEKKPLCDNLECLLL